MCSSSFANAEREPDLSLDRTNGLEITDKFLSVAPLIAQKTRKACNHRVDADDHSALSRDNAVEFKLE